VAGGSSSAAAEMSARRQRIGTVRAAVPRSTPGSARPIPLGQISPLAVRTPWRTPAAGVRLL